jgi:gluconolactonase
VTVVRDFADIRVVADGLAFPEGPVACADGSVVFAEVRGGVVKRCHPDGRISTVSETGGGPNGVAVGPDGALYICNNGGRAPELLRPSAIQRVDPSNGVCEDLYTGCDGQQFESLNDLVFDHAGGFWFTDFRGDAIYYAEPDGSRVERVLDRVPAPNGIGLSPDGTVLYWAQTHTRQIMRRRIVGPGRVEISPGYGIEALIHQGQADPYCLVAGLPGGQELDSLAVEAGGAVCVGTLVESGITVVAPSGEVVEKFLLPSQLSDGAVTNICFGGEDMCTAYVTLSLTGRVVACRWPRPGLRLAF